MLLTLDETRRAAKGSMPVLRRLRAVLLDLGDAVPPFRRPVIERQLALLDETVEQSSPSEADRALAGRADPRGIGTWDLPRRRETATNLAQRSGLGHETVQQPQMGGVRPCPGNSII